MADDKPVVATPTDQNLPQDESLSELLAKYLAGVVMLVGRAVHGNYTSYEYFVGGVTGTATINWANGNVQYVTLNGDTTFTFTNPVPGMRCILHVLGAYLPTFPSTVRWPAGVTPTGTATSAHKDIYSFVYSGYEGLYDGIQTANYASS